MVSNKLNKKICLIVDSSLEFCPYVKNYIEILDSCELDIIEWNRLKLTLDRKNTYIYEDSTASHQKNLIQYIKYSMFVKKVIKNKKYDCIIVFGIQMSFFTKNIIKSVEYIIDIRDYHSIAKLPCTNKVLMKSSALIVSSPGYKRFLPEHSNVLINHNYNGDILINKGISKIEMPKTVILSAIGANRDLEENIKMIKNIGNDQRIKLHFNGKSIINDKIQEYCSENQIDNCFFTGFYDKKEEPELYSKSDIINSIRDNSNFNNSVALPNKLYNAAFFRKPILTNSGSYLAELITKYKIGLIVDDYSNITNIILDYLNNLDVDEFNRNCELFLTDIEIENNLFKAYLQNINMEDK